MVICGWQNLAVGLGLLGLLARFGACAELSRAETLFADSYHLERTRGEVRAGLMGYEQVLAYGAAAPAALRARALFRIGVCQEKLGRYGKARESWSILLRQYRDHALPTDRARAALARLARRARLHTIRGRVLGPSGRPVPGAYVVVGDWRRDPPTQTGRDGAFVAAREGGSDTGVSGWPVFAEHPRLPLAGIAAAAQTETSRVEVTVRLRRLCVLYGLVSDGAGQPVPNAEIEVAVFVANGAEPLPADALVAPVRTGTNGVYEIANLPRGLSYGIRASMPGAVSGESGRVRAEAPLVQVPTIALAEAGGAGLHGAVVDQGGSPLRATIRIESMAPDNRLLATAETGADGRYEVRGLPPAPVTISVQGNAGYASRSLAGARPGEGPFDFALGAATSVRALAREGRAAPELAARSAATSMPILLAHLRGKVPLLYFWRRRLQAAPPALLAELHAAYAARGLAVVCLHDHSGFARDLLRRTAELSLPYRVGIDRYAPLSDSTVFGSLTMARYRCGWGRAALIDRQGRLVGFFRPEEDSLRGALDRLLPARSAESGGPSGLRGPGARALQQAPDLRGARWFDGAGRRAEEAPRLAGRVRVLKFGAPNGDPGLAHLQYLLDAFGSDTLAAVRVVPALAIPETVAHLAQRQVAGLWVVEDVAGGTRAGFANLTGPVSYVLDRQGRPIAGPCSDVAAFRALKGWLGGAP